jgi:uncharacterized protein
MRATQLLATGLLAVAQVAAANVAVPTLTSPVTDLTNTLTASQKASLEQTLLAFAERKGSQVAVLIVPSVEPEPIEYFSMRVAEEWKLGREAQDDGVLFLIAKDDRNMRIEVGDGLEGALTDAATKRIVRDVVTPHFRAGDFYLGIVAGTDRIMSAISGEALPEPTMVERARRPTSDIGSLMPIFLIGTFVIGGILRAIFGRVGGASLASVAVGFIVWLIAGAVVVAAIAAIIAFVLTLMSGGGGGWSSGRRRGLGGFRHGGGWGGGGFGGGGGGFSGGGASGRW